MRSEAIEALTQSEFVRITPAQQELAARATPEERQMAAVAIAHAREARRLLEEMGVLRTPSVLDVTRADVHHLGRRADALRRAMYELSPWWLEGVSLGQALKVAQPLAAPQKAVAILREAGHQIDDLTCGRLAVGPGVNVTLAAGLQTSEGSKAGRGTAKWLPGIHLRPALTTLPGRLRRLVAHRSG